MKYDPKSPASRRHLAAVLLQSLEDKGFIEEYNNPNALRRERVFYYPITSRPGMRVVIYSSLEGDIARESGKDAIRVALLYRSSRDNQERGIAREIRVNRTGEIQDVVARTFQRAHDAYMKAKNPERCPKCGAPFFTSKQGNQVCAEFCWKSRE